MEPKGPATSLTGKDKDSPEEYWPVEDSLTELAQLANTAGMTVVGHAVQRLVHPHPATFIGPGKVDEVAIEVRDKAANVVLFDDELSPRHQRELEKALGEEIKLLDRTALILDIFAQHAHTREGSLQVELAQYEYRLPRLTRAWTHLARQAGGRAGGTRGSVGVRGPGETQLETDRRVIGRRISQLKQELDEIRAHRQRYRARRRKAGMPTVALVGYTNAGKSTLLNNISGADVLVANQLFATLDPTTRRVELPSGSIALFTDTVGFIQKLPEQLIAAFRATLEEVAEADLLVHVIDVTHSQVMRQARTVHETLKEIGATHNPIIVALNKIDLLQNEEDSDAAPPALDAFSNTIAISALTGSGVGKLLQSIGKTLEEQMAEVEVLIPYELGELVNLFHRRGLIKQEDYTESGTYIRGRIPCELVGRFQSVNFEEEG